MNVSNSSFIASTTWVNALAGTWIAIVFVAGTVFNGSTLLVFVREPKLVTENNMLIVAIVGNGLCMCLFGSGPVIVAEFSGHWDIYLGPTTCKADAFIVYFFGLSSLFLHVAIAVHRCLEIKQVLSNHISKQKLMCVLVVCMSAALCLSVSPLLGFGSYGLEAHGTSCGLHWKDRSAGARAFIIINMVFCYSVPILILAICYGLILRTVILF